MRRETAYRMAGRKLDHPAVGPGILRTRELRFKVLPRGQTEYALRALGGLKGVTVEPGPRERTLTIRYSVADHTLESLETALREAGFTLENSLYMKLLRALVYFSEETQRHNLMSPGRLLKQSNKVYIQAWDRHLHGDHDETPPDLREYK